MEAAKQYPGIHLPMAYRPYHWQSIQDFKAYYAYADVPEAEDAESKLLQIRELAMMIMMDTLTDKPGWHQKVFDEAIVAKWRAEAMDQPQDSLFSKIMQGKESNKIPLPRCRIMSGAAFEYAIEELRVKARYFEETKLIPTLDSDGNTVVKSDSLIPEYLHKYLLRAFERLRHDQASEIDWHPGSNDMVQDLVHPSMYPFVYGRSKFMQDESVGVTNAVSFVGQGAVIPEILMIQVNEENERLSPQDFATTSKNFQWLPSNIVFREDGTTEFASYINNLHPTKYPEIYSTIEQLIDQVLPVWDQCLEEHIDINVNDVPGRADTRFERIKVADDEDDTIWEEYAPEFWRDWDHQLPYRDLEYLNEYLEDEKKGEQGETTDPIGAKRRKIEGLPPFTPYVNEDDISREKWVKFRDPKYPEPPAFKPIDYTPKQRLKDKFKKEGLQIIVKMASVALTPEKPEFTGGGWHIEGQLNERICATALYYVDCENVTTSRLSFRMQTSLWTDIDENVVPQDRYNWLERVHGTSLGASRGATGSCIQNYGDVVTQQGRLMAFPNVFQHCVSPFRLEDPTKPGHRRFIALWLIDPHVRVVSTANVPPQQKDWWIEQHGAVSEVPDSLMSIEEAKEHRLKLMEERSVKQKGAVKMWESVEYAFCEH